jgi:hypothetical protein
MSAPQLVAQRAANRWKTYHLAVSEPNTIFTARINQTFPNGTNGIKVLTYDGGTGTYSDVKIGMSCWIGSSAGARDIGTVRVRDDLTATTAPIGSTAGIALANNLYLTFVDDFGLWAKEPISTSDDVLIDGSVVFGVTSSFAPVVRVGPPALVLELTGATVAHTRPAPTIYSPQGASALSYAWTAPGASTTANMTTSTPTITYDTAGEYYESCAVTDNYGGTTTVYRKIFVNPPSAQFSGLDISGDIDSGGWSCRFRSCRAAIPARSSASCAKSPRRSPWPF